MDKIIIKYFKDDERAIIPTIAYGNTSACHDLMSMENIIIPAMSSVIVSCGLKVIIPQGYYLRLADRSGNGVKKGIQIHQGIIDSGYTGAIMIKLFNLTNEEQLIEKGKGICQVEVIKIPEYILTEATKEEFELYCENSLRGENGFGSSDKK